MLCGRYGRCLVHVQFRESCFIGEHFSNLGKDWTEGFTWTTPLGPEVNDGGVLCDTLVERTLGEFYHVSHSATPPGECTHPTLRLDPFRCERTVLRVKRHPAHGFPGGPPTPPYGDSRTANTGVSEPPIAGSVTPGESEPPFAPEVSQDLIQGQVPEASPSTPISVRRKFLVRALAVVVPVALLAGLVLLRSNQSSSVEVSSGSTLPPPAASTVPPPTNSAQPGPALAGLNTFASIPVDNCASMIERIGAANPFVPGVTLTPGTSIGLESGKELGQPTWVAEIPEGVDATALIADMRPPAPSVLRGISDGMLLLYSPLDIQNGTSVGIYRAANGELVWTAKLPPNVYPVADTKRLYLVDHRSPTQTNIAAIAPSLAQITACFAASGGSTVPRPSPQDRTIVAHDGTLYAIFQVEQAGARIEAMSDAGMAPIAENQPYPYQLHGVLHNETKRVLVGSSGTQGDLRVFGYDLVEGNSAFELTAAQLQAAPVPQSWKIPTKPSAAAVAVPAEGLVASEVRGSLLVGSNLVIVTSTNGAPFLATAIDLNGTARWRAGWIPEALPGASLSATHLYVAPTSPSPNAGTRAAAIFDVATGEWVGEVPSLRLGTSVGASFVGFSVWKSSRNEFAVIYDGDREFAVLGGATVTNVEPIALDPAVVVVYAEVGSRRLIVAYVLDPGAVEGPTS